MTTESDVWLAEQLDRVKRLTPPDMAGYPGSKGAGGVAERIIQQMPPHSQYIEGFAGHAAVFRKKARAAFNVLVDADPKVCQTLRAFTAGEIGVEVVNNGFITWMQSIRWNLPKTALVYLDPPYLARVRTGKLYDCEYDTLEDHTRLIKLAVHLPCMVMMSHYEDELYTSMLKGWRVVTIPAMTHGGMRDEKLWCNFDPPELLHDPRFAGGNYRERENIARRNKRWARKFARMPRSERQAIAFALASCDIQAVQYAVSYQQQFSPGVDRAPVKLLVSADTAEDAERYAAPPTAARTDTPKSAAAMSQTKKRPPRIAPEATGRKKVKSDTAKKRSPKKKGA